MTEVHRVTVRLRGPSQDDPGQVTDGYYIIDGDVLVMTHPDGSPIDEYRYRAHLQLGSNAAAVAGIMTKDVRRGFMGLTEEEDSFFNRPLNYSRSGVA